MLIEPARGIGGVEAAPQLRLHAEQREVARRDDEQADTLRGRETGEIVVVEPRRRDVLEDARALEILPFRRRHADALRADAQEVVLDPHQLLGMGIRQRMEQCRVDDAEDRRGRSDAQRDSENRDRRKCWRLAQHAEREAHVLQQAFQPHPATTPLVARDLEHKSRVAELAARVRRGIRGRFTARDEIGFGHFEMRAELVGELPRAAFAHPRQPIQKAHASDPSGGRRRPAMASVS